MRAFLIKASKSCTAPIFSLKSLASTSGRLDVVLRSIISAFWWGEKLRKDVTFYALLEGPPRPPLVVEIHGTRLKKLPKSETELAEIFCRLFKGEKIRGFKVYRENFRELVRRLSNIYEVVYLHEDGVDIRTFKFTRTPLFILGDHEGLDSESEEFLKNLRIPWISLGPIPYLASHCVIMVNEELDRKFRSQG